MQVLCVNQWHYPKSKIDSRYWPIMIVTCKMQTKNSDIKVPKLHMLPKNPKARGSVWLSKSMDINRLVRFRILQYIAPLYDRIPMRLCSISNVRGAAKTAGPAAGIAGLLLLYYWVANNTHFQRSVNRTLLWPQPQFIASKYLYCVRKSMVETPTLWTCPCTYLHSLNFLSSSVLTVALVFLLEEQGGQR